MYVCVRVGFDSLLLLHLFFVFFFYISFVLVLSSSLLLLRSICVCTGLIVFFFYFILLPSSIWVEPAKSISHYILKEIFLSHNYHRCDTRWVYCIPRMYIYSLFSRESHGIMPKFGLRVTGKRRSREKDRTAIITPFEMKATKQEERIYI